MWATLVSKISGKTLLWGLIGGLCLWSLPPSAGPPPVRADLLPAVSLQSVAAPPLPSPRDFAAVLLQEADSGQVLFARHEKRIWPLASLTKMMVGLIALEALRDGRVSLHTPVTISRRASRAGGRSVNLRAGETLPFGELLQAMLVTSANGAAIAVAEHLSGSVEAYIREMNARATALGMHQTRFQTVNGLPPSGRVAPDQASALDLTILTRALLAYPQLLDWTSRRRIPFRAGKQRLRNTNFLVGRLAGVDGLKTGYTAKARFNLVTTAKRDGLRLIAVVRPGRTQQSGSISNGGQPLRVGLYPFYPAAFDPSRTALVDRGAGRRRQCFQSAADCRNRLDVSCPQGGYQRSPDYASVTVGRDGSGR